MQSRDEPLEFSVSILQICNCHIDTFNLLLHSGNLVGQVIDSLLHCLNIGLDIQDILLALCDPCGEGVDGGIDGRNRVVDAGVDGTDLSGNLPAELAVEGVDSRADGLLIGGGDLRLRGAEVGAQLRDGRGIVADGCGVFCYQPLALGNELFAGVDIIGICLYLLIKGGLKARKQAFQVGLLAAELPFQAGP